ncbi:hypothetical protein GOP47_0010427 [Adiantum capillus-veneris]|uniref:Thioredoxin domain-containing protein n=1 Tax=Adiantum capillus-veneris TaxID=13818 RepID=A0A9D4UUZ5_ADICA|nr:hypothetical protein GOP47_0010427 [Adiantum capillus-veneris]
MEALHTLPSFLQQRELRVRAASPSLCCSSHLCGELCLPPFRVVPCSRIVAVKAYMQVEDAGARPLSSICNSSFATSLPAFSPSSGRHHSSRIQSAKKTYSSFDDLLNTSDTALLVDFYATWCGPCQFMVPILDDVGRALKDKLRIVKIDSEKYPTIASRYGVQALPTMILFQNGQPIDRLEGALSAPDLIKRIEGVLSAASSAK